MPRRAFTLMELLVVVAVIAVLVGIIAVSISGVRGAAKRTESLSALRNMGMGHSMYSQESNSRLLPGYIGANLMAGTEPFRNLTVSLSSGQPLTDVDLQSYVWRLAPFVDDSWQTFFGEANAGAMARFTEDYQRMADPAQSHTPGLISELPSFGLNSIFVGGDSVHGGVGGHNPWDGNQPPKAATRVTHVVNPAKLIVFAPAAGAAAALDDVYSNEWPAGTTWPDLVGSCELRAPYLSRQNTWTNQQWFVGENGRISQATTGSFGSGGGLPIVRTAKDVLNGGKEPMPVVHFDGSTAMEQPVNLTEDMRRWSQRKDVQ